MLKVFGRITGVVPRRLFSSSFLGLPVEGEADLGALPQAALRFVEEGVRLCQPRALRLCDGSVAEGEQLVAQLQQEGILQPLPKYDNCWLCRTDPRDVARVESRTVLVTEQRSDAVPPAPPGGGPSQLGNWMSPEDFRQAVEQRFPGCMAGRTLFVIPFSMGPVGSPLAKVGLQLTDSPYVAASMRIMTRVGQQHCPQLAHGDFVRCLHSVGRPLPLSEPLVNGWPCDPSRTLVAHVPSERRIVSFGSGYGGNSLLAKKCFALRIASRMARDEGWLAEHMLILGITDPKGRKRYIAAAFPSACGKTNLAMMRPSLPGWKVNCVGDDIAWMKFDDEGRLRAINPESGFFGVAPGTSEKTNPVAMATMRANTIFTNVAHTSDGGVYWEGIDQPLSPGVTVTSWLGKPWAPGASEPCAHPNSRFCSPLNQCPSLDPAWDDPRGVPIDAIVFGGRRPQGVPLVYEAFNWRHGVFVGSAMRSEATAAAEHKGRRLLHDPFAMRPFFGYNAGDYLGHWLSLGGSRDPSTLPKIFHVNWFLQGATGEGATGGRFLWPGFGHNSRVLAWICGRVAGEAPAQEAPFGLIPPPGALDLQGLPGVSYDHLFPLSKGFWEQELQELQGYYQDNFGRHLPPELSQELKRLQERVRKM